MDKLRRIIIQKSENGYKFSIKDIGIPYGDAAPVNKVVPNGPADCAGLRSGDGLVAINSNLVKGKNHQDICNIIKSSDESCLELAIIENLFTENIGLSKHKPTTEDEIRSTNTTPLSLDDGKDENISDANENRSVSPKSPHIIRKRAYNILDTSSNNKNYTKLGNYHDIDKTTPTKSQNSIRGLECENQPKINFKPAKSNNSGNNSASESIIENSLISNVKLVNSNPSKLHHHPAYKYSPGAYQHNQLHSTVNKRILQLSNNSNNIGLPSQYHKQHPSDSHSQIQSKTTQSALTCSTHERRGSTPTIPSPNLTTCTTISSITNTSCIQQQINNSNKQQSSTDKLWSDQQRFSHSSSITLSHELQNSTPHIPLQLNRVGGLVRTTTPLSVDQTDSSNDDNIDDELEQTQKHNQPQTAFEDVATKKKTITTSSNIKTNTNRHKFRYLFNSPTPYKSTSINSAIGNSYRNSGTNQNGRDNCTIKIKSDSSGCLTMPTSNYTDSLTITTGIQSHSDNSSLNINPSPQRPISVGSGDTDDNKCVSLRNNSSGSINTDINLDSLHFNEFDKKKSIQQSNTNTTTGSNIDPNSQSSSQTSHHYQRHYHSKHHHNNVDNDVNSSSDASTSTSRHLKKLKSIFGDNYRGRSKTLDSERKLKEDEDLDQKTSAEIIGVFVKWITYEGKNQKSSWKQFSMCMEDEDRMIFTREKMQTHLTSSSLEEVTMQIQIKGAIVEEESEKRGRKNTIKIQQHSNPNNQSECLIEFSDKTTANKWLIYLKEKSKIIDKDDKAARSASFKERHSLTVPNLYSKETLSVQSQFTKAKSKSKDESAGPSGMCAPTTNPSSVTMTTNTPTSSKGVIHQAMSTFKNLKHKFGSTTTATDFERQQEEWYNRQSVGPSSTSSVAAYNSTAIIQSSHQNSSMPINANTNSISTTAGILHQNSTNTYSNPNINQQNNPKHSLMLTTSNSCTDDIWTTSSSSAAAAASATNTDVFNGASAQYQTLTQSISEAGDGIIDHQLPLHHWTRSIVSPLIPLVVELCVSIIEKFGMTQLGLYRVSGNKIAVDTIYNELRRPVSEINVNIDKWNDVHAVAGVLKLFLRNLPDGLFPKSLYSDIIGACRLHEHDRERRLLSLQRILSIMDVAQDRPELRHHRETLRYLVEHLARVASNESYNKMTVRNLAVIFAPNLLRPPTAETNQMMVNDYNTKIQLIESLIKYHKWLFSPTFESACNIPPDLDDDTAALYNPPDDSTVIPYDISDSTHSDLTDARALVSDILERVKKILASGNCDIPAALSDLPPTGLQKHNQQQQQPMTFEELSLQAHRQDLDSSGFKEVDIDEECEKRLGNKEKMKKLRNYTQKISSECSNQLEEIEKIQDSCYQDNERIRKEIDKIDKEIKIIKKPQSSTSSSSGDNVLRRSDRIQDDDDDNEDDEKS